MKFTFITSDEQLSQICVPLANEPVIGVDLEADAMHAFKEKICLIQIAGSHEAFLVDPFEITDFSPFIGLLENPQITKIFHGADFDVRSLDRDMGARIQGLVDTEIACRFLNIRERGLGALLKSYFDVDVDKKYQKVDWSRRPLKEEMIAYSVADVAHLIPLYQTLEESLKEMGRLSWAKEEYQIQSQVSFEPNNQLPLFKRFKGAGKMDNRTLAVLENLLQTRLFLAEKKDLPPFKIMSNQSIGTLAEKKPCNVGQMIALKALSKKQADMYGGPCKKAIEKAMALPGKSLPSYPKTPMPKKDPRILERIKRLKKTRERLSEFMGMEPGFLINNQMITAIAIAFPGDLEGLLAIDGIRRWQTEAIGEAILETLTSCG